VVLVSGIVGALVLAGCGSGRPAARVDSSPAVTPVAACVRGNEQRAGGFVTSHGGGRPVSGVVLGSGSTGVVLANQSNGDLCQWQPYGLSLVQRGYRVALFNYTGQDSPPDVLAAVDALRAKGAQKVFLIGASMGGSAVLDAATQVQSPVAGVVDLSGPESYAGANALAAVKKLTVPALFIAGQYDSPFVDNTRNLYAACVTKDKQLTIEPSGDHGVSLLNDHVTGLIEAFLAGH
jgi:pimeloyl-ACP methyl ester carboxylesterase